MVTFEQIPIKLPFSNSFPPFITWSDSNHPPSNPGWGIYIWGGWEYLGDWIEGPSQYVAGYNQQAGCWKLFPYPHTPSYEKWASTYPKDFEYWKHWDDVFPEKMPGDDFEVYLAEPSEPNKPATTTTSPTLKKILKPTPGTEASTIFPNPKHWWEFKTLWVVRGIAGSGKTSLIEILKYGLKQRVGLNPGIIEVESFFETLVGNFDTKAEMWPQAYEHADAMLAQFLEHDTIHIILGGPFSKKDQMDPFIQKAKKLEYSIREIICKGDFPSLVFPSSDRFSRRRMKQGFEY